MPVTTAIAWQPPFELATGRRRVPLSVEGGARYRAPRERSSSPNDAQISGYAANHLAIVRRIVMNPLQLKTAREASIKSTRMLAATVDEFCAELPVVMT